MADLSDLGPTNKAGNALADLGPQASNLADLGPSGPGSSDTGVLKRAIDVIPASIEAVAAASEKAAPYVQRAEAAIPGPVKKGFELATKVPLGPIGATAAAQGVYEAAAKPSRAIQEASQQFLEEKGARPGWAMLGGFVAGAPFDPLLWIPIGKVAKATEKAALGLTKAGTRAAERTVASMSERTGEVAAAQVPKLVEEGNLRAVKTLIDSGQTNLALSAKDSALLNRTVSKADDINKLWQTRNALRTGAAEPIVQSKIAKKIQKVESDIAEEVLSPYGKNVDRLRAKRDALALESYRKGSYDVPELRRLNHRIEVESRAALKSRESRIAKVRGELDDLNADLEASRKSLIDSMTKKIKKNLEGYGGMKLAAKERLAEPLQDELIHGIIQWDDKGFLGLGGKIRRSIGDLTGHAEKMDDLTNGAFTRYIWRPQVEAEAKLDDLLTGYRNRLRSIQETAGVVNEGDDALFRMYREGALTAPAKRKAAFESANKEYQSLMDEMLDTYNRQAVKMGSKKIIVPRDQYVFHTRKMNALFDLTDGHVDELAKDAKSVMYVKHNDPQFYSWKRRFDAIPESQLAGAFEAADKYANYVARYEAYSPMVKKFRALSRASLDANKPNLAQYFGRIADNLTGDAVIKSGKGLEEASGGMIDRFFQNKANKIMSRFIPNAIASFSSGVNQVAGTVNNAIYGGIPRALQAPIEGVGKKVFQAAAQSLVDENYWIFAMKNSKIIRSHMAELPPRFMQRQGNLLQRTTLEFFKDMNDSINIGTFNTMYKAAKVSGYGHEQAVKIADDILAKTQAVYRNAFRPTSINQSSALGKLISPLSTYVFRAANAMGNDVMFSRLGVIDKAKSMSRVFATGVLVNAGVYSLTGKRPWSNSDYVPFLRMFEIGPGVSSVIARSITRARHGQYGLAAVEPSALLLPGGSRQIVQTISGARAIKRGDVEGPVGSAKALLFGAPYKR